MDEKTPSFPRDSSSRWRDRVTPGAYLSPAERRAFEKAIHCVSARIDQVLSHKDKPRTGIFDFDAFVDSLEADFLRSTGDCLTSGLNRDIGQTAFRIIRGIADHLIALQVQRHAD
ncbi:DNA-binding protein [Lonsdalea populi]|uniref:DNA-binding protein n=2 Tax=Lonsdalea populi TaxID=1172565 RepID=A0A3N0UWJ5_9GAMM|nr:MULTISPECIES: DNA-binding protein [Lonsdalea]RAT16996.1 DNA-binding protein [Lonsdalea quercina]RAT31078.1 DNA-binding protein [Lonsdalea populi]RAT48725.1 DNA-binding protein [Lonsdalea populi]RAT55692.1 DNA-binding protein [Lonsdalea populi]RAT56232.1 DNA-binding protein [Lonsdalea populi]